MYLKNFVCIGANMKQDTASTNTKMSQIYYYRSFEDETIEDMKVANFFSEVADQIRVNDLILLYAPGAESEERQWVRVDSNGTSGITVSPVLEAGIVFEIIQFLNGGNMTWNSDENTVDIDTLLGATIQVGQETLVMFKNTTGSDITNGSILHPLGGTVKGATTVLEVELADASNWEKTQGTLFVATHDVADGEYGLGTRFGKVRDLDTTAFGANKQLWLSATNPGQFTDTRPQFPNYAISMGGTLNDDDENGEIFVNITTSVEDTFNDAWDGAIRETFDFRVTSDGTDITGTLSNPNADNDNLTLTLSDGLYTFDAPANGTILLTPGTATTPQMNYIYIPIDTKVLTVSTSGFPTTEHCKVAVVYVKDAVSTQNDGALRNQNLNDHIKTDDDNGHILHMAERIRTLPAQWQSGIEAVLSGNPTNLYISTTSGKVWQMHLQDFPAQDMSTGDDIHVVNDPSTPYRTTTNLNDITVDANGDTLNNKYFSLVIWGVANKTGEISHLMCNLPTGSYSVSEEQAINDSNGYSNFTIPTEFKGTGFLIGRFTMRLSGGSFTYDSATGYQDLRGFIPNSTAGSGAGSSGITTFLGLVDTPGSYTGNAGKVPKVNDTEDGLEFVNNYAKGYINGGVASKYTLVTDIPVMTSNTAPTGYIASASQENTSEEAYRAYDGDISTSWDTSSSGTLPSYNNIQIPVAKTYKSYALTARELAGVARTPTAWTLEASNTGAFGGEEVILDTQTGVTFSAEERKVFVFSNTTAFLHYRFVVTSVQSGTRTSIASIELSEENMTESFISITSLEARSDDNTTDISLSADSLDVTSSSNWASGIVPTLTSTTIHTWATETAFKFDDIDGSNIAGSKRRVSSLITDSNGDLVPFFAYELAGGGVDYTYDIYILDWSTSLTTSVSTIPLSAPNNTTVKMSVSVRAADSSFTGVIRNKYSLAVTGSSNFDFRGHGESGADGSVSIKHNIKLIDGNVYAVVQLVNATETRICTNGYIDERTD